MIRVHLNSQTTLSLILSIFVFVLVVDPTSTMLNLKDITFIILVVISALFYPAVRTVDIITILIIYGIVVASFIFGLLLNHDFYFGHTFGVIKGFAPIILLLWIGKYRIIKKIVFPSLMICFIVITTFLAIKYHKELAETWRIYFVYHGDTLMFGRKTVLGIELITLFYKSLPVLLIPASIFTYKFFNTKGQKLKNFIMMCLILVTILLGGTRASILSGIIIIAFNFFLWLYKSDFGKIIIIPVLVCSVTFFGILFFAVVFEKEGSNKTKFAHMDSYTELIMDHPSILVLGQGPGSTFFSKGRNAIVVQTELSYFEIIRMFGVIGASMIILLFLFPLYLIFKKRKVLELWISVFLGYLLYLFVGGTNPLLLGSTGMLVMLGAYSYARNPYYELKPW